MHKYLNESYRYDFRQEYLNMNDVPVSTDREIEDEIEDIRQNDQDPMDGDWTDNYSPMLGSVKKDHEFFNVCMHTLEDNDPDDYFIYDYYNLKCHPLDMKDLNWLRPKLKDFLCNSLDLKFQIKWILNHKKISDNAMAKKLRFYGNHVSQAQISYFKTGKRKIGNMALDTAVDLGNYYTNVIRKKQLL